jgi:outer membrane receptor protein involved in Fe transport
VDVAPPEDPPAAVEPIERAAPDDVGETVVVVAPAPITAASALTASSRDVRLRPLTRPGDLVELMPGAFAVQHAGGGKANQYFLRGFDLDHGTDLALSVAGIPVNQVSHAHGQGYADLNFVVPELVERVDVRKGPYEVSDGDLATAGALDMALVRRVDDGFVLGTLGMFGTWRGLGVLGLNPGRTSLVAAAEAYGADGPFEHPQGFRRFNGYASVTSRVSDDVVLGAGASVYDGRWHASGQIPLRAVEDGSMTRFGSVDPTEGGSSWRHQGWATVEVRHGRHALDARGWAGGYGLDLFSNFTFFAADPVHGDGIEQQDRRRTGGYDVAYAHRADAGPVTFHTRVGAQGRVDEIDAGLWHQQARERLSTTSDAKVVEARTGLWAREEVGLGRWARLIAGLRYDLFTFAVRDRLASADLQARRAGLVSPKASLVVTPHRHVDLFANFGRGFHSNDARGVLRAGDPADPFAIATGYEGGVRVHHDRWGQVALVGWGLELTSETVWVGDEGTTEPRGATHRHGFEGSLRVTPLPWLLLDLDITVSRARYVGLFAGEDAVALAPPFTATAGVGVDHPSGLTASVRLRHLSDRPATEDRALIAKGWTVLDAVAGWRWRFLELRMQVNNLTNTAWREVQFANESRLPGEPAPVQDLHLTPGWPTTVLATMVLHPGAIRRTGR